MKVTIRGESFTVGRTTLRDFGFMYRIGKDYLDGVQRDREIIARPQKKWTVNFREKGSDPTIGGYFTVNEKERDELTQQLKALGARVIYEEA